MCTSLLELRANAARSAPFSACAGGDIKQNFETLEVPRRSAITGPRAYPRADRSPARPATIGRPARERLGARARLERAVEALAALVERLEVEPDLGILGRERGGALEMRERLRVVGHQREQPPQVRARHARRRGRPPRPARAASSAFADVAVLPRLERRARRARARIRSARDPPPPGRAAGSAIGRIASSRVVSRFSSFHVSVSVCVRKRISTFSSYGSGSPSATTRGPRGRASHTQRDERDQRGRERDRERAPAHRAAPAPQRGEQQRARGERSRATPAPAARARRDRPGASRPFAPGGTNVTQERARRRVVAAHAVVRRSSRRTRRRSGPKSSAVGPSRPPPPLATSVARNAPVSRRMTFTESVKNDVT